MLPLENVILVIAFDRRYNRIRKQAMIDFTVGKDLFQVHFLYPNSLSTTPY